MSVPADALDEKGRGEIISFYSDVFGWQELPTETIDRKRLVMMAYTVDQFVFLHADDPPMSGPRLDHFGLGVATLEELDTFYERAKRYRDKDDRVDIIDKEIHEYTGITLTSFYVRYLLPLMVEVQHFAFH
ncbi:MAG TPA: VOC family protein [Acidimicrobiales bacterium]